MSILVRALRSAIRTGVDPYNSHPTQAQAWKRAWADKLRRYNDRQARREERGYDPYHAG